MIEQNAVYGKHAIAFAVILGYPETILLGYSVWRTGIERSRFLLRDFLHQSEQLGGRCLINLGFLFQSQYTYRLQHTQRTYRIRFRCVFGHIEAYFYMALCGQIINLVRLYRLYDAYQ